MDGEISATRSALNSLKPDKCSCSEINGLANTLDQSVERGLMDIGEAIITFSELIDSDCQGKKDRPEGDMHSAGECCSVPGKICGHVKGGNFLIAQMMKLRVD